MRYLSPEMFQDEWLGCLEPVQRLLWIGLLACCADDQGRLKNNPVLIRVKIFPYDPLITTEQIQNYLKNFETSHKLLAYPLSSNGSTGECLQIVNWWKYQERTAWAAPSKLPAPESWTDRIRCAMPGHGTKPVKINWDQTGGFSTEPKKSLPSDNIVSTKPLRSDNEAATKPLRSRYIKDKDKVKVKVKEKEEEEKSLTPAPTLESVQIEQDQVGIVTGENNAGKQVYKSGYTNFPENPAQAAEHPIIKIFGEVTGRIPGISQYKTVIETISFIKCTIIKPKQSVVDYLKPYWLAWSGRKSQTGKPYSPANLTWLTEWAVNGNIPEPGAAEQILVHPPSVKATHKRLAEKAAQKFVPPPQEVLAKIHSLKSKLSKE